MNAALITGGAKRLGREIALHLAENGYGIALHYNHSKAEAEIVKKEIEAKGRACVLLPADLADTGTLAALVQNAKAALPKLNVLINNASVFDRAGFAETDEALFDRQMDVNFKAPFFLTQAFAKTVTQGHVVNILDTNITNTHGSHFAYLLSKKLLAEFTHMAARALGPAVRVNGVCPGIVLTSGDHDEAYRKKLAETLPLQANATPLDVAKAIVGLLNLPSVTGQILFVDGGQHLL